MNEDFYPTVTGHRTAGDTLVLETLDPREETNFVAAEGEPLKRKADYLTDEQQEKLA